MDMSRSGWHPHPSVLYPSPICVGFCFLCPFFLSEASWAPLAASTEARSISLTVKCIAQEVGGTVKTQTKKVGLEKDPVVLKACLGYEAVEAVDLQWGWRLRGQRSAGRRQYWGKCKAGQNEPSCQHPWITADHCGTRLLVFNNWIMTFYSSHRSENPKAHDYFFCTFTSEAPSDTSRGSVLRVEAI